MPAYTRVIARAKVEEEADLWQPDFRHEACKKVSHE